MITILTGSGEFFPKRKDLDYVCFREQKPFFEYIRDEARMIDWFMYREDITKAELAAWHNGGGNKWWLNFAPLITKGYLEHLGIDLFGEDREWVYGLFHKVFTWQYRFPNDTTYGKWLYRIYIYTCFMRNGTLELSERQLRNAFDLYRRKYPDPAVIRGIYEFFEVDPEEIEIGMEQVFGEADVFATEVTHGG